MGLPCRRAHLLQRALRERVLPGHGHTAGQHREPGGAARLPAGPWDRGHGEAGRPHAGRAIQRGARYPGRPEPVKHGIPGYPIADVRGRFGDDLHRAVERPGRAPFGHQASSLPQRVAAIRPARRPGDRRHRGRPAGSGQARLRREERLLVPGQGGRCHASDRPGNRRDQHERQLHQGRVGADSTRARPGRSGRAQTTPRGGRYRLPAAAADRDGRHHRPSRALGRQTAAPPREPARAQPLQAAQSPAGAPVGSCPGHLAGRPGPVRPRPRGIRRRSPW